MTPATSMGIGPATLALAAAPTDKRLVVVILRGALDGMAAVVPYGDPDLAGLRGEIVPAPPGQPGGLLDLGGFFGVHPALAGLHAMYQANEAVAVHAVAGSYRVRSHFEAQDYLESGADHRMTSGWLNRAVAALTPATPGRQNAEALALAFPFRFCFEVRLRWPIGHRTRFRHWLDPLENCWAHRMVPGSRRWRPAVGTPTPRRPIVSADH
jgi:uncharacterized protein (DUF1501 family)